MNQFHTKRPKNIYHYRKIIILNILRSMLIFEFCTHKAIAANACDFF
jgi:hypothetical protein